MFHEQVSAISQWFTEWNEAEKMVVLYSLLKRLSTLQVKFLSRVVDQHLTDCADLQILEQQANNPAFIMSLLTKGKDMAISQLLIYLPLLRPDNVEAKSRYLAIIPTVLSHSVETGDHLTEAKQLISYSLIHPAIPNEDRKQLTRWVQILKARFNLLSGSSSLPMSESPNSWNASQQRIPSNPLQQVRVRRSNSLTPPVSLCQSTEVWTSQDDLSAKQKPRSFSLSSEHGPQLSPQSSQASSESGSETQLDETKVYTSDSPGMRDIGTWLKTLRLHKYIWFFVQLTYEELLGLTDEKLEAAGVTKGARQKIIFNVEKLRDRYNLLCQLKKEVTHGMNLMIVLEELKTILSSPIKPLAVTGDINETENKTDTEDIPSQFTEVLGKVCTHLIISGGREEDAVRLATWLLGKCLAHECFVPHKERLETWRSQVQPLWQLTQHKQRWYYHNRSHFSNSNSWSFTDKRFIRRPSTTYPNRGFYLPRAPYRPNFQPTVQLSNFQPTVQLSNFQPTVQLTNFQPPLNSFNVPHLVSPPGVSSLHGNNPSEPPSQNLHREFGMNRGGPPQPFNPPLQVPLSVGMERCRQTTIADKQSDSDINSKLEDLCLSMAEHFLEGVS